MAALCDDRMLAWVRSPYNYGGMRATRKDMEIGIIGELRAEIRELRIDTEKELIRLARAQYHPISGTFWRSTERIGYGLRKGKEGM